MTTWLESLTASPSFGEMLALSSGLAWAVAVILFRVSGRKVHPIGLNLFKTVLALVIMAPTMLVLGESFFPAVPASTTGLLLISGALGVAVSDTLFFHSLNRLGASLVAIVDCFYAPFVIGLSFILLGERMTGWQLAGAALVVSAVLTITREKRAEKVDGKNLALGILYGILAMFFVALGIVMVKPVLGTVSVVWATLVRLAGGAAALVLLVPFLRQRRAILGAPRRPRQLEGPGPGLVLRLLPLAPPLDGRDEIRQSVGGRRPQPAQHDLHRHHRRDLFEGTPDGMEDRRGRPGLPRGLPGLDALLARLRKPWPRA